MRTVAVGRRVAVTFLAAAFIVALLAIAAAYLDPALRKAIVLAGLGLC